MQISPENKNEIFLTGGDLRALTVQKHAPTLRSLH